MGKTKFKVDILRHASENEVILKTIGNHNGGLSEINLVDIRGYCNMKTAMWPNIPVLAKWHETDRSTLVIIEEGEPSLVITKIELHDLAETDESPVN